MTTSFGKPRLVAAAQVDSMAPADMRAAGSGGASAAAGGWSSQQNAGAVSSALVDQLADALGAAEARCAAQQRPDIQPLPTPPFLQLIQPTPATPYINAESAPFLHNAAAAQLPPPLPAPHPFGQQAFASPVEQWIAQLARPETQQATQQQATHPGHFAETDQQDYSDLPRFFDRNRPAADSLSRLPRPPAAALSPPTMAFGFVIGLAVIVPTLWLMNADKITELAKRSAPLALTTPMLTATAAATLVPAAAYVIAERGGAAPTDAERAELAQAAFDEASRRIAAGDYIGARDQLQQAMTFGEERARALLSALE